jgi:chromate reductase, NAD(P)H dehydrogenase (quinone)
MPPDSICPAQESARGLAFASGRRMTKPHDVVVLVGSLRKESFTRKIALALRELAKPGLALEIVEIGNLPHYNQDLETNTPPAEWVTFRNRLRHADAVLFATPEYNRSVPGVLKNAIDVGSRPREKSVFNGKPAFLVSVSPGLLGAFGANHHLRQSLVFLNMPAMQQPEVYLSNVVSLLGPNGDITNASTRDFLTKAMASFADWIELQTSAHATI